MTFEHVAAVVENETGRKVTGETALNDLGLDSLEFLELLITVSNKCGDVPDALVPRLNTVSDLYLAASGQL